MPQASLRKIVPATLLALAASLGASAVMAQEVELFSQPGFNGMRLRLSADTPDVAAFGMGNAIASVLVKSGQWEFCTAAQFRGACITVGPGRYAEMPPALRGTLASIRVADIGNKPAPRVGTAPNAPVAPPPPVYTPSGDGSSGPVQGRPGHHHQAGQPGAPVPTPTDAVVLNEHANFDGRPLALSSSAPRLGELNFNDEASSVLIQRGRWQLCEHYDYGGECVVLGVGQHVLSGRWNDRVSSIRPVFGPNDQPLPPTGAVVLHENTDYSGRQTLHMEATPDLRSVGMNDRASSIEVLDGEWQLCTDANYGGRCVVVKPGRYQMGPALDNRMSSLRPASLATR